jgi:DNA modification methylase
MDRGSVHTVVTSPPYYGLRDYGLDPVIWEPVRYAPMPGLPLMALPTWADPKAFPRCVHDWTDWGESHDVREAAQSGKSRTTDRYYGDPSRRFDGNHQKHAHGQFCRRCGAWRGCLGLEPTPELYIGHLVQVFRALWPVLRDDGTLWLNLGDSYSNGGRRTRDSDDKLDARGMTARPMDGRKPKDLMGIPWLAAFALQADGWTLRSDIVWGKSNPMPESVRDRPTKAHEMLFLLSKGSRYFYDHVAIREPHSPDSIARVQRGWRKPGHKWESGPGGHTIANDLSKSLHPDGRNRRDVWLLSTKPYKGAHFAVMPPDLVEPCILAGTSEAGCCPHCGKPWVRKTARVVLESPASYNGSSFQRGKTRAAREALASVGEAPRTSRIETMGLMPQCGCSAHAPVPCVVLDPFSGAGTVWPW